MGKTAWRYCWGRRWNILVKHEGSSQEVDSELCLRVSWASQTAAGGEDLASVWTVRDVYERVFVRRELRRRRLGRRCRYLRGEEARDRLPLMMSGTGGHGGRLCGEEGGGAVRD